MNESLVHLQEWAELIENVIYQDPECPSSFEEKFCDGNELISVSFTSQVIHVYYLLSDGQHIHNTFPLTDLNDWLEQ